MSDNEKDYLPESANELVKQIESNCICSWTQIPDPNDKNWKGFRNYPRVVNVITYHAACRYGNHGEKGSQEEKRYFRFTETGAVEDLELDNL
jgi:hypothetical protein